MRPSYCTDLCFHTTEHWFRSLSKVTASCLRLLGFYIQNLEGGKAILAVGNPFWVSHAVDYFAWQDLPGREWELLMELSFMGFVCLMWWWNVLGVLFKERGKTVNVGGEEKHANMQCNLLYYCGIGLESYICEDLCISYFPNDWSVLLVL